MRGLGSPALLILITGLLVALGGCAEPTPTPETATVAGRAATEATSPRRLSVTAGAAATAGPSDTAREAVTPEPPTPTPSLTPTPTPTATPAAVPTLAAVDLGVSGGDCFGILDLVVDPGTERLYALCHRHDGGAGHAVVAVDAGTGRRLATAALAAELADEPYPAGQLALDPGAGRLYITSNELDGLVVLDTGTLDEVGWLSGVRLVASAPGTGRFFALTDNALTAYDAGDLSELAVVSSAETMGEQYRPVLAYNEASEQVYLANTGELFSAGAGQGIRAFASDDLSLEATIPVTETVYALDVDSRANRIYACISWACRTLVAIDGETHQVKGVEPGQEDTPRHLLADERTGQVHLVGGSRLEDGYWAVIDGETLETQQLYVGFPARRAMALDAEGRLLAAQDDGDVVVRYDPDTGQPAGRLVLGRRVLAAAVHPDDDRVYALDSAGGLVVLDAEGLQEIQAQPAALGSGHPGLRQDTTALGLDAGSGRLFVADEVNGQTLALDLETLEEVGRLEVAGPMAVDAVGGRLFVGDVHFYVYHTASLEPVGDEPAIVYEPSQVSAAAIPEDVVFDAGSGRLFLRVNVPEGKESFKVISYNELDPDSLESVGYLDVPVGTRGSSPVVFPRDNRVWLAYDGFYRQGMVAFADDYVEVGQIKELTGRLLAGPDYLYLLRGDEMVVLDPERGHALGAIPLKGVSSGAVLDGTGERLYLWGWDHLATITTADLLHSVTRSHAELLPAGAEDLIYRSPSFEEDHTLFAAIPEAGIYRSTDAGETWQLSSWGLQNYALQGLAFSPDYGVDRSVIAIAAGVAAYRSTDGGETWLPNGRPRLAFVSDRTGDKEIYTIYYADDVLPFGSEPTNLTNDGAEDDNPAWSPDGTRIVFESDWTGNKDLWIMDWDGGGKVHVTADPADDTLPAWSPDGWRIAFTSWRDGNAEIYVMDAPEPGELGYNEPVVRLTDHPGRDWGAKWSPDGRQVAFWSDRTGEEQRFVVDRDGSDLRQLTGDGAEGEVPSWVEASWAAIHVRSDLTGNADLYHTYDTGPRIRRLTEHPAEDTAPAWSSILLTTPELHTPLPPSTGSPTPPPPTLPPPSGFITAENALWVNKRACWESLYSWNGAYSPDGRLLAVNGKESYLLYDSSTLELVTSGEASGSVYSMAFGPRGVLLAVWGGKMVDLWDVSACPDQGQDCARRLVRLEAQGTSGYGSSLSFSPDGRMLLAASDQAEDVLIWRVAGCYGGSDDCGSLWYTLPTDAGVSMAAFSPDGQFLATLAFTMIRLYHLGNCEAGPEPCVRFAGWLHGADFFVDRLAWSPDSSTLAAANDGGEEVWLFDMSGCPNQDHCGEWVETLELPYYADPVVFGPDWTVAALGAAFGMFDFWAVEDGRQLHRLDTGADRVQNLVFNPRDASLASIGDHTVCVWHLLPEPRAPNQDALLYEDDFSDPDSGWTVLTKDDYEIGYQDGEYRLAVDQAQLVIWGSPGRPESLSDFAVEVDARLTAGALESNFGILVRYEPSDDSYYLFQIAGDGSYSVVLLMEDEWTTLVPWMISDAVNEGVGAENHLQVICDGDRLTFYVNGVTVADVVDSTLRSGTIGLAAGTFDEPGVDVRFDNLRVYALEQ